MTHDQRTEDARAEDVRAHNARSTRRHLPTPPTVPTEEHLDSSSDRTAGFRTAHENSTDSKPGSAPDDDRWIVAYRINRTNSTVLLGSLAAPITEILRRKHWTTLVRDQGWAFPLRYLAFVERLLAGADTPVELFDLDGAPTPGQIDRGQRTDRARLAAVLADNEAARKASQTDPAATERARRECRQAYDDAIAAARARRGQTAATTTTDHDATEATA